MYDLDTVGFAQQQTMLRFESNIILFQQSGNLCNEIYSLDDTVNGGAAIEDAFISILTLFLVL